MKKLVSALLAAAMILSCAACSGTAEKRSKKRKKANDYDKSVFDMTDTSTRGLDPSGHTSDTSDTSDTTDPSTTPAPSTGSNQNTNLSLFITAINSELDDNNEIRAIIAEMTGVSVIESYLPTGRASMTADEAVNSIIASNQYPDLLYCTDGASCERLYLAGVLEPWDEYLDDPAYSNLRALYSDAEWELFRQPDGHIYWADVHDCQYGETKDPGYNDCAFWIQVRVLEWAGYPKITTLDDYFTLIDAYYTANPTMKDGSDIIPYTMIYDDWRTFGLELPARMLSGYAFNELALIDTYSSSNPTLIDYNVSDIAKEYYRTLNEAYNKGLIDPNFRDQSYDEYTAKLLSGRVLGFFDFHWDSTIFTDSTFPYNGLSEQGCDYVPLFLTIDENVERHAQEYTNVDHSCGLCVTTQNNDPQLIFEFMNRILDQDIHDLRFWGVEGEDYAVGQDGLYYRDDAMAHNWASDSYQAGHICRYYYLPHYTGTSRDGINAMQSEDQPAQYFDGLPERVQECLEAYGCTTIREFFYQGPYERIPWMPLYNASNSLNYNSPAGKALDALTQTKNSFLPDLVKCDPDKFDAGWEYYLECYDRADPDTYFQAMQDYLDSQLAILG